MYVVYLSGKSQTVRQRVAVSKQGETMDRIYLHLNLMKIHQFI